MIMTSLFGCMLMSQFLTRMNMDLGIVDPRKDDRLGFLGGDISRESLEARVRGGKWQVALALPPVSNQQFRAIADQGHHMPPKSTWFEPKLLSGLVMLDLAEAL